MLIGKAFYRVSRVFYFVVEMFGINMWSDNGETSEDLTDNQITAPIDSIEVKNEGAQEVDPTEEYENTCSRK